MLEFDCIEILTLKDCPATRATLDKLSMLGLKATVTHLGVKERDDWNRRGFRLSPIVIVWVYEDGSRKRHFTWDGYKPKMLELTRQIATAGMPHAASG